MVPRRCRGEHRLLVPIRPIALTLCDIFSLRRDHKLVAVCLAVAATALLLGAYFAAAELREHTFEILYAAVRAYVSRWIGGAAYQGALHLLLANGAFIAFRLVARAALYSAYELGRDRVFALLVLTVIVATTAPAALALGEGRSPLQGSAPAWGLLSSAILGWFWIRYLSPQNPNHKSFDFDVAEALVRLRRF